MSGSGTSDEARRMAAQSFARANDVIRKGDHDYAITLLKQACKFVPEQMAYRQALRAVAKKKFDNNKRGSRWQRCTTVKSRATLKAAKAKKDYHRAIEASEDVLSENPWDSGILLEQAELFDALGLIDLAVWSAENALERDTNDATVNRALAIFYEKRGAFMKAINCWERVKKARPADEEADRRMKDLAASATIDKGGYDKAESFTHAIADKAKTQELLDDVKGGTVGESRVNHQIEELQRKIKADPTIVGPYLQLAQLYRRHARFDEATALIQRGVDATGKHPDALAEQAEIEMDRLKADLAVAEKQFQSKPNDAAAKKRYQDAARTLNDYELREFQRRCELLPTDMSLRCELGIRFAKSGLFDQAIAELQKARNDPRRKTTVLTWLGRSFHAKKNPRLAHRHYKEALESLGPTEQDAQKELHYLLGRVSEELGDKVAALQHYEEVAAQDYGYKDVAKRVESLQSAAQS